MYELAIIEINAGQLSWKMHQIGCFVFIFCAIILTKSKPYPILAISFSSRMRRNILVEIQHNFPETYVISTRLCW